MFERRLFFHVDWLLLAAVLVLTGIGVVMIYSTTYVHLPEPRPGPVAPATAAMAAQRPARHLARHLARHSVRLQARHPRPVWHPAHRPGRHRAR